MASLTTAFAISFFDFSVIAQNNNNASSKEEEKTTTKERVVTGGHGVVDTIQLELQVIF